MQKQHGQIKVKALVSCEEDCSATGSGTIATAGGSGAKGRVLLTKAKPIKLKPQSKEINAGGAMVLRLKVKSKKDAKVVAKAVKAGRKVKANIKIEVDDEFGNADFKRRQIKLA